MINPFLKYKKQAKKSAHFERLFEIQSSKT